MQYFAWKNRCYDEDLNPRRVSRKRRSADLRQTRSRRKSGSDRVNRETDAEEGRQKEKREKGERGHLSPECVECVRHPRFASLPSLREPPRRRRNQARLLLSHFYSFSTLFLDYGLSAAPFVIAYFYRRPGRPAVIYFGTKIRFAKHRTAYCVPHRKAAFIVIFTFTSWPTP